MTPTELVSEKLDELKKALAVSRRSYDDGLIDKRLHNTHKRNITPKITEYERALHILIKYM
jgi:hypothetical protein